MVQLADKAAAKDFAPTKAEKAEDKKAVESQAPGKSKSAKAEQKRADGLAEAFPGSQPDPGPEPRPAIELSKEQKAEAEDVREIQVKALEDNQVNVPAHNAREVLAHRPGSKKGSDNDVAALTFMDLGGEVIVHVEAGGDLHFNREEFAQLQRVVSSMGGTL